MTTEQVEPVTEAGRALLADEWWTGDDTHIAFVREKILAAEAEARALDVVQLKEAFRTVLDRTTRERVTPFADLIAAEYDRLSQAVR